MTGRATSTHALGRSYGNERTLTALVGLIALLAGLGTFLLGLGLFGSSRAHRPVLEPLAVDWLTTHPLPARAIAITGGLILLVLGLWWVWQALRPESHPDIHLDRTPNHTLTVTAGAITDAVEADTASLDGVTRVRVHATGTTTNPALRIHIWLSHGTELTPVWQHLNQQVLAHARDALNLTTLPTAIRFELDSSHDHPVR